MSACARTGRPTKCSMACPPAIHQGKVASWKTVATSVGFNGFHGFWCSYSIDVNVEVSVAAAKSPKGTEELKQNESVFREDSDRLPHASHFNDIAHAHFGPAGGNNIRPRFALLFKPFI